MIFFLSMPFNFRYHKNGTGAHLWFFYKQLHDFRDRLDDVFFIGYEGNYALPSSLPRGAWELDPETCRNRGYAVPSDDCVRRARVHCVDQRIFSPLQKKFRSANLVCKYLIQNEYPPYKELLLRLFSESSGKPEALILICNDATAEAVAASLKIPVIHTEIGPTRFPDFIQTAYWDSRGVNGNTEAEARFRRLKKEKTASLLSRSELLTLFANPACLDQIRKPPVQPDFLCGVAGQVEDDSNLLAYSNGFDNLELFKFARYHFGAENVLFRPHPSGQTLFSSHVDLSGSSALFLSRIGQLLTINSSMALEAALLGKPVTVFGGSPFRLLSGNLRPKPAPAADRTDELNFLLLHYCIPFDWMFCPEYYRWRLSRPSESEIRDRHLQHYLKLRGFSCLDDFRREMKKSVSRALSAAVVLPPDSTVSLDVAEIPFQRRDAENYRKSYESERADAENYRKSFESAKQDAENYRASFESAKQDAENYRASFESAKQDAENYRASFESAKQDAENYRKSFESAKQDAENYHKSFESAKRDAENYRKAYESERADAENYRASFESAKQDAENYRASFESAKQDAENYRASFESAKQDAENYRKSYESERADAENYRKSYDSAKQDAENYRKSCEYLKQEVANYKSAYEFNEKMHLEYKAKYEALLAKSSPADPERA